MRLAFPMRCILLGIAVLALVCTVGARADIYTQTIAHTPYDGTSFGTPSQMTAGTYETASLFTTSGLEFPAQLSWYGFYTGVRQPVLTDVSFTIRLMENNHGVPGAILESFPITCTPGNTFSTDGYWTYSADIRDSTLVMPAGNYWVSVLETDSRTTANWNWQYSADYGNIAQRSGETGDWGLYPGHQVAYILQMAIPEPTSFLAWAGLGAAGCWIVRQVRRKSAAHASVPVIVPNTAKESSVRAAS